LSSLIGKPKSLCSAWGALVGMILSSGVRFTPPESRLTPPESRLVPPESRFTPPESPSTRIGTSLTWPRVRLSGGEDSPLGAGAAPMLEILDLRFCAAPEIATAILPPNWREEGGPLVAWAGLGGPVDGAVAAREARDPDEIEAATRSRSTPGGVDPAPTITAVRGKGPTTWGP